MNARESLTSACKRAEWRCERCQAEQYRNHPRTGEKVILSMIADPAADPCIVVCGVCRKELDKQARAKAAEPGGAIIMSAAGDEKSDGTAIALD